MLCKYVLSVYLLSVEREMGMGVGVGIDVRDYACLCGSGIYSFCL